MTKKIDDRNAITQISCKGKNMVIYEKHFSQINSCKYAQIFNEKLLFLVLDRYCMVSEKSMLDKIPVWVN